jgi:hypothetical protein
MKSSEFSGVFKPHLTSRQAASETPFKAFLRAL